MQYKLVQLQLVKYKLYHLPFLSVDSIAIQVLEEKIKTESIPDISGDADTPVGHVSYSLSKYVYLTCSDVRSGILLEYRLSCVGAGAMSMSKVARGESASEASR